MKKRIIILLFLASVHGIAQQAYKEVFSAMGCNFTVTVVADTNNEANSYIYLAQ